MSYVYVRVSVCVCKFCLLMLMFLSPYGESIQRMFRALFVCIGNAFVSMFENLHKNKNQKICK